MYTEVTRIRKPDPHVHEGDPNPVHTEVAKMAVFGSDICADLSGSCWDPRTFCSEARALASRETFSDAHLNELVSLFDLGVTWTLYTAIP